LSVFGAYSNYYDLLYEDKNYSKEVEFVSSVIRRHAPGAATVLDLGCGTGIHACAFAREGYQVTGLDRSADMLAAVLQPQERSLRARIVDADVASQPGHHAALANSPLMACCQTWA
jgi:predicted TPR repeat methyltransferase